MATIPVYLEKLDKLGISVVSERLFNKEIKIRSDDHILEVIFWLIQLFEKNFVFVLCFDKFY